MKMIKFKVHSQIFMFAIFDFWIVHQIHQNSFYLKKTSNCNILPYYGSILFI